MNDLDHLKRRAGHAVERLAEAQNSRRDRHESLLRLLSQLEVKFEARHEELAYCHSRIAALEKSNGQLSELLETVVQTVELSYVEDANDPIARAAKLAADLVERDARVLSVSNAASAKGARDADSVSDNAEEKTGAERAGAIGSGNQKQADSDMSFDVVTAQELALEDQRDREAGRLPPSVMQAVTAARQELAGQERPWERKIADALAKVALAAEHLEEDEDVDLPDIPGIDNAVDFDIVDVDVASMEDREIAASDAGGNPDAVRDLMSRLQKAAENAPPQSASPAAPRHEPPVRRSSGTDD